MQMTSLPSVPGPGSDWRTYSANPFVAIALRQWKTLFVCLAIGSACGVWVSNKYVVTKQSFSTTLLYSPSQGGAPYYAAPDIPTATALVKDNQLLVQLAKEFPPHSSKSLSQAIRTEFRYGSNAISIRLEGENPDRTKAILERLVQLFGQHVDLMRRSAQGRIVENMRSQAALAQQQLTQAKTALKAFNRAEGIVDLDHDMDRLQEEIAAIELKLENVQLDPGTSVDPQTQRRNALREMMQDERDAIAARTQLTLKRNDFERARALHERRFISDAEFRRIETELQALEEQDHGAVRKYRDTLQATPPSALAQQTQTPGEVKASDTSSGETESNQYLRQRLAERKSQLARLASLRWKASELAEQLKAAADDKVRVDAQLSACEQWQRADFSEVSVIQAASPVPDSTTSNRKKLFAYALAAVAMVLASPFLLYDLLTKRRPAIERLAERFELPVLARGLTASSSSPNRSADSEEVRKLALRIQQSVASEHSAVLFTSLSDGSVDIPLLHGLACCFAERGESVLLIDVGQPEDASHLLLEWALEPRVPSEVEAEHYGFSPARELLTSQAISGGATCQEQTQATQTLTSDDSHLGRPGLADYLTLPWRTVDDIVLRTANPRFDCITRGNRPLPAEGLATRRMSELVGRARERYSLVLVAGPRASQLVDIELMAARCDAIVLLAGEKCSHECHETIADLMRLRAPILGLVD